MSFISLQDLFPSPWILDAHTFLWSLSTTPAPSYVSENGVATVILARGGVADPPPFIQRQLSNPLDLRQIDELRFWFRSSRPGDGSSTRPFYLVFEITNSSSSLSWKRLIPVKQADVWQLHQMWLGDMPSSLRQAISILRLHSLDAGIGFTAVIGDLIATTPTPIQDVDAVFLNRLNKRFQVVVDGTSTDVPAIIDLPENPGTRTLPYILITPWSIQLQDNTTGSGELIDNYTLATNGSSAGAFIQPAQQSLRLDFSIDVFAEERSQKAYLLEQILFSFYQQPLLVINGEPITITKFTPSDREIAAYVPPGRTPLFYQVLIRMKTGERQFRPQAVPFILASPDKGTTPEAVPV
ncbi:hypothetical protein [Scytonema sp. PCC 10023]|uniref:hypothetical protein n=1 Tax=Scytonema sp. PCC 10023 TaxID=1680591 RepID=UPI0039C645F0